MYAGPPLSDKPLDANGEREWTHGICNCFGGCGTCCLAFFLPCLVYGQVKQRIDHLQKTGRPDPEYGGCGCGWPCCAYFSLSAACGLGWILQVSKTELNMQLCDVMLIWYLISCRLVLVLIYAIVIESGAVDAPIVWLLFSVIHALSLKKVANWTLRKNKIVNNFSAASTYRISTVN